MKPRREPKPGGPLDIDPIRLAEELSKLPPNDQLVVGARIGVEMSQILRARKEEVRDASKDVAGEWVRGKHHRTYPLKDEVREQREADAEWRKTQPRPSDRIPEPRQTLDDDKECLQQRTDAAVERAREACQAPEAATDWGVDDAADDHAVRVRV